MEVEKIPASNTSWTSEILLAVAIVAWIVYELYGRTLFGLFSDWLPYIRIAAGIVFIVYLWWQKPEEFKDTLAFAKDVMTHTGSPASAGAAASMREKRNVTGLQKKKTAADQGWRCGSCQKMLDATYEVDHRVALFQGGTNDPSNLVALCPQCHRTKTVAERLGSV
jgi:hypothetical protein